MVEVIMRWIEDIVNDDSPATALMAFVTVLVFVQGILVLLFRGLSALVNKKINKMLVFSKEHIILNFNSEGLGIRLFFTLASSRIDTIVKEVKIKLKRRSQVVYELKWDTFYSTYYDSIRADGSAIRQNIQFAANRETMSYSHPMYLKKQETRLFYVGFADVNAKKALELETGEYDLIFEIFSTEKKKPFRVRNRVEFSDANINALKGQRGKKFSANANNQELVSVEILEIPNMRKLCRGFVVDWIKQRFNKGGGKKK